MTREFAKFSLEEFVRQSSAAASPIEITASVEEDGEFLVLRLDREPSETVYRLPRSSITVVGPVEDVGDATFGPLMRLRVERKAPCLRLTAAQARMFFEESRPALLTDRAVRQASVAFTNTGEGHLKFGSITTPCLGNPTVAYTRDLTVRGEIGEDKFLRKFSNEFQVWMDFAILIMGQRGIYIHEGLATLKENGGPTAGCIHVAPPRAKEFYDFVSGPTRILISYPW